MIQQTDERVRRSARHDKMIADAMSMLRRTERALNRFTSTYPESEGGDLNADYETICRLCVELYAAERVLDDLKKEVKNGDDRR